MLGSIPEKTASVRNSHPRKARYEANLTRLPLPCAWADAFFNTFNTGLVQGCQIGTQQFDTRTALKSSDIINLSMACNFYQKIKEGDHPTR